MSEPDFIEVLKGAMELIKEEALKVRPAYLNSAALVSKEEFEYIASFPGLDSIISLRSGYRDSDTGRECPSADSIIIPLTNDQT